MATAGESQELIYGPSLIMQRAHSSAWIEWLPAKQLVEGSSPSEPVDQLGSYTNADISLLRKEISNAI